MARRGDIAALHSDKGSDCVKNIRSYVYRIPAIPVQRIIGRSHTHTNRRWKLLTVFTSRQEGAIGCSARALRVRLTAATLGILFAVALIASPSALADAQNEPASANGYHSAFANLTEQLAAKRAGRAAPSTNGVPAALASESGECGAPGYIQSRYNGLYVSTEVGYPGNQNWMLRARATSVGAWELYQICYNGYYTIYADASHRWVTAEVGYTGAEYAMLRGRATSIGPWEKFVFSGDWFASSQNGLFVSAEFGYPGSLYGMLRARSGGVGQWEEWNF